MFAKAKAGSIVYCMGITQHTVGTDNVKSLANLAMLCGNIGIYGGGVNPLRGQNNVQGACDMGGLPNVFSGYQPVTDAAARQKMEAAWGVAALPDWVGKTMTDMLPSISKGDIKALYIIGENPALTDPDSNHAVKEMQQLEFLVVQDIFLTETGKLADVVLPAASFAEKDGTFANTERRVARVRQAIPPVGQSRPDWQIICEHLPAYGLSHGLRRPRSDFRGDPPGHPVLCRHHLPAPRGRRVCSGPAPPSTTPAPFISTRTGSPRAWGRSSPSTTRTRRKCPTRNSPCTSPPVGSSTSTIPAP